MDILTKFEIIHPLMSEFKDNGLGGTVPIARSFIPTLLTHSPPKNLAQLFPGPPAYARKHIYKFIPAGLFSHLIINLLKWIGMSVSDFFFLQMLFRLYSCVAVWNPPQRW